MARGSFPDIVAQGAEDPPAELLTAKKRDVTAVTRTRKCLWALGTLKDEVKVCRCR